jgi:hypothetical protein
MRKLVPRAAMLDLLMTSEASPLSLPTYMHHAIKFQNRIKCKYKLFHIYIEEQNFRKLVMLFAKSYITPNKMLRQAAKRSKSNTNYTFHNQG